MTFPSDTSAMAKFSMGGSMAGAGVGALGSLIKGQSGQQMYSYQAGIAQLDAKIASQNRDYAYGVGEQDALKYGMGARQRMGAIRAGEGASGIDIGSGSKAAVQQGQQVVTDIDLATIRNNAARKAYGFSVEATQDTAQAALYSKAGSDAMTAGEIGAIGSMVSGTASVADKWLQAKSTGLGGVSA